jgi:hypothetical protein
MGGQRVMGLVGQVVLVVGLGVIAVSFAVPFASNDAGCLDHCADAGRYYVWFPFHNPGAPFLLAGIVASVLIWRTPAARFLVVTWLVAQAGWLGILTLDSLAKSWISEYALYGGPELEDRSGGIILLAGWITLQAGIILFALGQPRPATPHPA